MITLPVFATNFAGKINLRMNFNLFNNDGLSSTVQCVF